ncbi:MAG TPA: hypothetical protein VJQ55_10385 [Candidatus Binatia bacterium]|nr:hypothetical protein [Candidatus Binatia bacterium]
MRSPNAMIMAGGATPSSTAPFRYVATKFRLFAYLAAVSPFLLLLVVVSLYPELNRPEVPEWRSLLSRADEAVARGDVYEARRLYLQVDRVAYWRQDWEGLVAAACRINRLDGIKQPHGRPLAMLFRASAIAERAQSSQGLEIVAKSLAMLGSAEAAAVTRARIQPSWSNHATTAGALSALEGCSSARHP